MPNSQLNLNEAAEYLHLKPDELEKLIRSEDLVLRYVKDRPIFSKRKLHDWMSKKLLGEKIGHVDQFHENVSTLNDQGYEPDELFISQYLDPKAICSDLQAKTKNSLLRELVKLACNSDLVTDHLELLELIEEREQLCSTGLENGVAMPHSRVHADYLILDSFLVIAHVPGGIPFGAQDGKLSDLFLMPCAHNDRVHLHMIARLALLLHKTNLANELRSCADADEMADAIRSIEQEFMHSKCEGN